MLKQTTIPVITGQVWQMSNTHTHTHTHTHARARALQFAPGMKTPFAEVAVWSLEGKKQRGRDKSKVGRWAELAAIALLAWKSSYSGRGLARDNAQRANRATPPRERWLGERDENNSGRRILRHFAMRRD